MNSGLREGVSKDQSFGEDGKTTNILAASSVLSMLDISWRSRVYEVQGP